LNCCDIPAKADGTTLGEHTMDVLNIAETIISHTQWLLEFIAKIVGKDKDARLRVLATSYRLR